MYRLRLLGKEKEKEKEKERGKELLALVLGPATTQKRIPNAKYVRYNSKEHNTKDDGCQDAIPGD